MSANKKLQLSEISPGRHEPFQTREAGSCRRAPTPPRFASRLGQLGGGVAPQVADDQRQDRWPGRPSNCNQSPARGPPGSTGGELGDELSAPLVSKRKQVDHTATAFGQVDSHGQVLPASLAGLAHCAIAGPRERQPSTRRSYAAEGVHTSAESAPWNSPRRSVQPAHWPPPCDSPRRLVQPVHGVAAAEDHFPPGCVLGNANGLMPPAPLEPSPRCSPGRPSTPTRCKRHGPEEIANRTHLCAGGIIDEAKVAERAAPTVRGVKSASHFHGMQLHDEPKSSQQDLPVRMPPPADQLELTWPDAADHSADAVGAFLGPRKVRLPKTTSFKGMALNDECPEDADDGGSTAASTSRTGRTSYTPPRGRGHYYVPDHFSGMILDPNAPAEAQSERAHTPSRQTLRQRTPGRKMSPSRGRELHNSQQVAEALAVGPPPGGEHCMRRRRTPERMRLESSGQMAAVLGTSREDRELSMCLSEPLLPYYGADWHAGATIAAGRMPPRLNNAPGANPSDTMTSRSMSSRTSGVTTSNTASYPIPPAAGRPSSPGRPQTPSRRRAYDVDEVVLRGAWRSLRRDAG
eukprot:gnl/TRDRNA2_/TRDRNA2_152597_c0_seq1.p1 gnl/TRDRNA2_/TRDRNA2_152597_c0~~gnl/TRDRNA2_/TRDRNA2_152597_c0_seq1.p1  ORF type:complete len:576 (+),score=50.53 gnl/TRDRNA2_/TRDRNA2_152597_c0_seq1:120-1847(+)